MNIENIIKQVVSQLDQTQLDKTETEERDTTIPSATSTASNNETFIIKPDFVPAITDNITNIVKQVVDELHPAATNANMLHINAIANSSIGDTPPPMQTSSSPNKRAATNLAQYLEHSLLVPDIDSTRILELCSVARKHCIAAVTVAPYYVAQAVEALRGSPVKTDAAIAIPNAAMSCAAKIADIHDCVSAGATEIDVALNNLAIKSGNINQARAELNRMLEATKGRAVLKVAFEHCLFTEPEKEEILKMLKGEGVEYIKIQNVLSGQPAKVEDIDFVRQITGKNVKIKIDGGVKTAEQVQALVDAGASRIGTSSTFDILSS